MYLVVTAVSAIIYASLIVIVDIANELLSGSLKGKCNDFLTYYYPRPWAEGIVVCLCVCVC